MTLRPIRSRHRPHSKQWIEKHVALAVGAASEAFRKAFAEHLVRHKPRYRVKAISVRRLELETGRR